MKLKTCLVLLVLLKALPSFSMQADTIKVFYSLNDHKLSNDDQVKINSLKDSLNNNAVIKILGYGDNKGTKALNLALSQQRASTAKAYLLSLNSKLKVSAKGLGQVISSNDDPKLGNPMNRRIDIISEKPIVIVKPVPVAPTPAPAPAPAPPPPPPAPVVAVTPKPIIADTTSGNTSFDSKINDLSKLEVGSSLSFEEFTFVPGKHDLDKDSKPYLDVLLNYLKKNKTVSINLQGFICCDYRKKDGYDGQSKKFDLSVNRAKSVYDYLVANGIDASRLKYEGLGNTKPKVFPEVSDKDREANRRVGIVILSK